MDKSAVGFEYQSKTEKHESQKGLSCIHCLTKQILEDLSVIFPCYAQYWDDTTYHSLHGCVRLFFLDS